MGICPGSAKQPKEPKDNQKLDDVSPATKEFEFTPDNLGHHAKKYLSLLALPLPVTIAMFFGACIVHFLGFRRFLVLKIVLFGFTPVLYRQGMKKLGELIKAKLEEVDQDYLGVDLHIGELDLSICSARFVINDFQLDNPKEYKGPYLLKCKQIVIDVDMLELLMSVGKKIVVEEFTLDGIDVILEYDSIIVGHGKTNLDTVMEFMSNRGKDDEDDEKKAEDKKKADEEKKKAEAEKKQYEKDAKPKKGRETIIQKVAICDVGAKIQAQLGLGPRFGIADIRYKNFTEQFGKCKFLGIVQIILKSILKSVIATVAGKAISDKAL